jgi:hypothetical protein
MSTFKEIEAGVPQGSILSFVLHNLYVKDSPESLGTYQALFAVDVCVYTTKALRKIQVGLMLVESWCELSKIKINKDETHATFSFSGRRST